MPVKLENISTIAPNSSGQIDVPSDLNLVGTSPNPVYRINGVPLATGASQTPWLQDIDGASFLLNSVRAIGVGGAAASSADPKIQVTGTNQDGLKCITTVPWGYAGVVLQNDVGVRAYFTLYGSTGTRELQIHTTGYPINFMVGTNAPQSMRITAAGDVGIGTPAPAYKLDVVGDINLSSGSAYRINGVPLSFTPAGSNGQVQYNNNGAFGAGMLWVMPGGNVGMGVAAPPDWGAGNGWLFIRNTSVGIRQIYTGNDIPGVILASLQFCDANNTFASQNRVGEVSVTTEQVSTAGQRSTSMIFTTYSGGGATMSERMRITGAGNVGIGTVNPTYKLDVRGVGGGTQLHISHIDADVGGYLGATNEGNFNVSAGAMYDGANWIAKHTYASAMWLYGGVVAFGGNQGLTPGSVVSLTPHMTILPSGNVGIGTPNPTYRLHVSGARSYFANPEAFAVGIESTGVPIWLGVNGDNSFQISNAGGVPIFLAAQSGLVGIPGQLVLTYVVNAPDDATAGAAGVPLYGIYHTNGTLRFRMS